MELRCSHSLRTSSNLAFEEVVRSGQGTYHPVLRDSRCFLEVRSIDSYGSLSTVPPPLWFTYRTAISRPFFQLFIVLRIHFRFPDHLNFRNYTIYGDFAFTIFGDLFCYGDTALWSI